MKYTEGGWNDKVFLTPAVSGTILDPRNVSGNETKLTQTSLDGTYLYPSCLGDRDKKITNSKPVWATQGDTVPKINSKNGASEMTKWTKALTAKPSDLSHMMEGEK